MAQDQTERLCLAVYRRKPKPLDYLGGSEALMLRDAADLIARLREENERLQRKYSEVAGWYETVKRERDEARREAKKWRDLCSAGGPRDEQWRLPWEKVAREVE